VNSQRGCSSTPQPPGNETCGFFPWEPFLPFPAPEQRVRFNFKSMEQGPTFRISVPNYTTQDPSHRILAHQRSRFTHFCCYIRDEVLGPVVLRMAGLLDPAPGAEVLFQTAPSAGGRVRLPFQVLAYACLRSSRQESMLFSLAPADIIRRHDNGELLARVRPACAPFWTVSPWSWNPGNPTDPPACPGLTG